MNRRVVNSFKIHFQTQSILEMVQNVENNEKYFNSNSLSNFQYKIHRIELHQQ